MTTPNYPILYTAFHIFVKAGYRDFKLGTQDDCGKTPLIGRGQITWPIKIFLYSNHISGTAEARVVKSRTQAGYIKCQTTP